MILSLSPSIDFPGTYYITPFNLNAVCAEFCDDGNIKIQICTTEYSQLNYVSQEDLELLYTKARYTVWIPLFFNGRLL